MVPKAPKAETRNATFLKTVLLAESHPPTLEHLTALLSQAGYTVRAVREPGAALEHLAAERPDAVVLAVDLPRLDGAHLARLVRQSELGARVPLVAIDKGHLGRARGVGAVLDLRVDAYVADPLKAGELVGKLEALESARQSAAVPEKGLAATLSRPPVASGELKGLPLPALLHASYRLQRDGVLVVALRDLTRRVYLLRGTPVGYDSTARQDALPGFLLERGVLTEPQAERVVQALAGGLRVGAALAEAGVEAAGEVLLGLLRDYTRERLAQLVGMREGRYALYPGDEFAPEIAQVEVPALAPLLEGARRAVPLRALTAPLKPHLDAYPTRTATFGRDLGALGLGTDDLKLAMQINGRLKLRDLLAHGRGGDLGRATSLAWFLQLTGALAFSREPLAGGALEPQGGAPEVLGPRKRKPLPPETAAQLREAAVRIITGSYFHGLGLDITADSAAVERAYQETAARFHPDSYPEHDTTELRDLLDSVQDKLAASYRVLSSEKRRREYLQYLVGRLDAGRAQAVSVDAEIALKRGEAALRRKDAPGALKAFEDAVALSPREPEYYSYLAWATYLLGRGSREERARAAQRVLKRALALNPTLERAHVISAIIDAEAGDAPAARRRLLRVLESNPHSRLAKAALRKVGR